MKDDTSCLTNQRHIHALSPNVANLSTVVIFLVVILSDKSVANNDAVQKDFTSSAETFVPSFTMSSLSNEVGISQTPDFSGSASYGSTLPVPLKIGVSSVASSERTEDWRVDELHDFVLCIIERNVSSGQKADEIMILLTKHELPQDLEVNEVRREVLRITPFSHEERTLPFNHAQPSAERRPSNVAPGTFEPQDFSHSHLQSQSPALPETTYASMNQHLGTEFYRFEQLKDTRPTEPGEQKQVTCADLQNLSSKVSSAESELDSVSSETEDAPFLPLPGSKANGIVEKLQAYFGKLIDSQFGIIQHISGQKCHGTGSSNTPAPCQPYVGDGNQSLSSKRGRRSEYGGNDGSEAPGDQDGDQNQRGKRRKVEDSSKKRIACPFVKRYPAQFSTWRTCGGPGFDGINRMREHLKRRHFKEHCCGRCGQQFKGSRLLQAHPRADIPCALVEISPESGFMSQIQWDEISGKRAPSNASLLERWREIYLALFPDIEVDATPGPYFDLFDIKSDLQSHIDPNEYNRYLKQNLPGRIIVRLNEEFHFMAERAKQRLLEIIQQESSEILKNYLLSKGIETHHPQSQPASPNVDTSTFADNSFHHFDPQMAHLPQSYTGIQPTPLGPLSSLLQTDMFADLSWLDDDKDPAESAYGSNMMGVNSSVGDN
ncbi:hypothetical protein F5Y16DRAFT_406307 [Xylariaceae sp. FL0255]|nr:hypothetical protein F5Y16DRAFT_406307 [Xylariaceae sp. FL0255]